MRILYTFNSGNPGGMEKHVLDLAVGMRGRGHEVSVWCNEGPVVDWFKARDITVITRRINLDIDPFYIQKLMDFLRLEKIDVIHAHELKAVVNSLIAAAIVGTEVRVSHTHTPLTEWKIGFFKKVFDIVLNSFVVNVFGTAEIALTESRKVLKVREGIREKKLHIIPNALDTTNFDITSAVRKGYRKEIREYYKIPEKAFIFGNVSRMTKEKNQLTLLRAFTEFAEKHPKKLQNSYLFLAGGGLLEKQIRREAHYSAVSGRIIVTGIFAYEDLVKFYSSFDCFVFPTLAEGFGYVLIEAMYMKLPVICSDLDVLREVGGDSVSFFNTRNTSALVAVMEKVFGDKNKYTKMGVASKKRVQEKYSIDVFIDAYEQLYTTLFKEVVQVGKKDTR